MQAAIARVLALPLPADEAILPAVKRLSTLRADELGRRRLSLRLLSGDVVAVLLPPQSTYLTSALATVRMETALEPRITAERVSRQRLLAASALTEVPDDAHPRTLPASRLSRQNFVGCIRVPPGSNDPPSKMYSVRSGDAGWFRLPGAGHMTPPFTSADSREKERGCNAPGSSIQAP